MYSRDYAIKVDFKVFPIMEINAETLYKIALEEAMFLKKQVIELKALYLETKEELDKLKL